MKKAPRRFTSWVRSQTSSGSSCTGRSWPWSWTAALATTTSRRPKASSVRSKAASTWAGVGDVAGDGQGPPAGGADLPGDGLQGALRCAPGRPRPAPSAARRRAVAAPDAAAPAGDQGHPPELAAAGRRRRRRPAAASPGCIVTASPSGRDPAVAQNPCRRRIERLRLELLFVALAGAGCGRPQPIHLTGGEPHDGPRSGPGAAGGAAPARLAPDPGRAPGRRRSGSRLRPPGRRRHPLPRHRPRCRTCSTPTSATPRRGRRRSGTARPGEVYGWRWGIGRPAAASYTTFVMRRPTWVSWDLLPAVLRLRAPCSTPDELHGAGAISAGALAHRPGAGGLRRRAQHGGPARPGRLPHREGGAGGVPAGHRRAGRPAAAGQGLRRRRRRYASRSGARPLSRARGRRPGADAPRRPSTGC